MGTCMSVIIKKVKILSFSEEQALSFLLKDIMIRLGSSVQILDNYGADYDHSEPWKKSYFSDPKFYLYRVRIGAIGRLCTCEDAIRLGLTAKIPAQSYHFVSMALYYVYRVARQVYREYQYIRKVEKWLNVMLEGRQANSRFMETHPFEKEDS